MRTVIFILVGAQIAFFVVAMLGIGGSDPMGNAMMEGFVTIAGMIMAIFLVPATILAISRKFLGAALALAIVPLVGTAVFYGSL